MYKYAETKNRVHRVHVDGGQAWKVEQCNLDDARYFGLLEEPPDKPHCKYCFRDPVEEEKAEQAEEKVPAIAKKDIPQSLLVVPRRLFVLLIAIISSFMLFAGNATGVVLSPDLRPSPTPFDWSIIIDRMIVERLDERILFDRMIVERLDEHILFDHRSEVIPSPSPSSTITSTPSPAPTGHTQQPITRPASTTTPNRSPSPTSTTAPTAKPSPAPSSTCYKPGEAVGHPDLCKYPHQP